MTLQMHDLKIHEDRERSVDFTFTIFSIIPSVVFFVAMTYFYQIRNQNRFEIQKTFQQICLI